MTHRGPFQTQTFCDYVILYKNQNRQKVHPKELDKHIYIVSKQYLNIQYLNITPKCSILKARGKTKVHPASSSITTIFIPSFYNLS